MNPLWMYRARHLGNYVVKSSNRKFLNFPSTCSAAFCSQSQIKHTPSIEEDQSDELDLDALKNEMFEDFETEKETLQTNIKRHDVTTEYTEQIEPDPIDTYDVFKEEDNELSFAAQQFKKRMEFNQSLRSASKIKSVKTVQYSSPTLNAGIPELLYDAEGTDQWVTYLRLYTYTPFTMGLFFVPLAIYGFPEWEIFPKLILGGFYMATSAVFPYFSYRAAKDKMNRVWLTPDCEKLIVEKLNFFFQPYKKEYFIKDFRLLYRKGSDRYCWFQCNKTKVQFLVVSELMQHPVWLQLLGVDDKQIADATLRNIANDGKVTMFRGPNTG
eukprot:78146_1